MASEAPAADNVGEARSSPTRGLFDDGDRGCAPLVAFPIASSTQASSQPSSTVRTTTRGGGGSGSLPPLLPPPPRPASSKSKLRATRVAPPRRPQSPPSSSSEGPSPIVRLQPPPASGCRQRTRRAAANVLPSDSEEPRRHTRPSETPDAPPDPFAELLLLPFQSAADPCGRKRSSNETSAKEGNVGGRAAKPTTSIDLLSGLGDEGRVEAASTEAPLAYAEYLSFPLPDTHGRACQTASLPLPARSIPIPPAQRRARSRHRHGAALESPRATANQRHSPPASRQRARPFNHVPASPRPNRRPFSSTRRLPPPRRPRRARRQRRRPPPPHRALDCRACPTLAPSRCRPSPRSHRPSHPPSSPHFLSARRHTNLPPAWAERSAPGRRLHRRCHRRRRRAARDHSNPREPHRCPPRRPQLPAPKPTTILQSAARRRTSGATLRSSTPRWEVAQRKEVVQRWREVVQRLWWLAQRWREVVKRRRAAARVTRTGAASSRRHRR